MTDGLEGNVTGFLEPRQEVRASGGLTGAWVNHDFPCAGFDELKLAFSYRRGLANGAFDYQIFVSLYALAAEVPGGAGEWASATLYTPGALVPGAPAQSRIQTEFLTYQEEGTGALESFVYGTLDISNVERVRVRVRESGVVGNPGTLQIEAMMR